MHAAQPRLTVLDLHEAVAQVRVTRAERLDLGPGEREPCLHALLDRVIEARAPVVRELDVAALLLLGLRRTPRTLAHEKSVERAKRKGGGIAAAARIAGVTKDPRLGRHHLSSMHTERLK